MDPERFVSLREIAERVGVSVSAVSLALRNSPKVSEARRREIQRVAEEMGYRRDPRVSELMEHLRTTRPQRLRALIGVLVPELTRRELERYTGLRAMIAGVRDLAARMGYGVDVFHLGEPGMTAERVRSILLARGIKGVVVAPFASGVARFDFDFEGFCPATAGYSIVEPRLHRACPDYLQMMDEILATCVRFGYRRIGLVMTYKEGGIGHKLFTSSYLYFQAKQPEAERIPLLPCPRLNPRQTPRVDPAAVAPWWEAHRPEVVIGTGPVYTALCELGLRIPEDVAFASLDLSEDPRDAAGVDHRHDLVGREAFKLVLSRLNLNFTGVPESPRTVLVDSRMRPGFSLPDRTGRQPLPEADPAARQASRSGPVFRGFVD